MGIPVDVLPVTMSGELTTDVHKLWLDFRAGKEATTSVHVIADDDMETDETI